MKNHICAEIVPIFKNLNEEDLIKISSIVQHKNVKKGEIIFSPYSQNNLVILSNGSVKVYQLNKNGKEQLLRIMQPGDFEGEKSLYQIENKYLYSSAMEDSSICILSKRDFQQLLIDYPRISQHLLTNFVTKIEMLEKQVELFNSESIKSKLSKYILDLCFVQNSKIVTIPFKLKELAAYLNTTPETLSRELKKLENNKLIQRDKLVIKILNNEELENSF